MTSQSYSLKIDVIHKLRENVRMTSRRSEPTWFEVKYHVDGLSIVRDLFVKAGQVKLVLDVIFVNLFREMRSNI